MLPKEEGESIRAGDEQVRPALYGAGLAQAADLPHRRLGEHPGVTAANNGLLAGAATGPAVQYRAYRGRTGICEGPDPAGHIVRQSYRKRGFRRRGG